MSELTRFYHTERRGIVTAYVLDLGIVPKLGRSHVATGYQELEPEQLPQTRATVVRAPSRAPVELVLQGLLRQRPMTLQELVRLSGLPQTAVTYALNRGPFVRIGKAPRLGGTVGKPAKLWGLR